MIVGYAFGMSIALCLLMLRRTRRLGWWIGGAVVMFAAMFGVALGLQDVPTEREAASAYRAGEISFSQYEHDRDRARAAYDYGAIAGAVGALVVGGSGLLARITAPGRTEGLRPA